MQRLLVFGSLVLMGLVIADPADLCGSEESQMSCGQCTAAHPDCGWCKDPHAPPQLNRCQLKTFFKNETCKPEYVYSPKSSEIEIRGNMPLNAVEKDGISPVRAQPQLTVVKLKKGHSGNVSVQYLHVSDPARQVPGQQETMTILTSDISAHPIKIRFFVLCQGVLTETKSCKVQNMQVVEIIVEVTLTDCFDGGDIGISVGFSGVRTVAGIYVSAVCRCQCEKQSEMNSMLCHQKGHLVCGKCVCQKGFGGNKCECPLVSHGVSSAIELENKCRANASSPVCFGKGSCNCGQCACTSPTISGKFCQCDNGSCPKSADGRMCSGNGVCDCGVCKCQHGWEKSDCSCSTANNNCIDNGEMCSNNGKCQCNRCICKEGKTGAFCGSDEATDLITQVTPVETVVDGKEGAGHGDGEDSASDEKETSGSPHEEEKKSSNAIVVLISVLTVFIVNLF